MNHRTAIKNRCTFFLLLLLSVSILPGSYVHNALAAHTDELTCQHPATDQAHLHPQGFHCGFDHVVVTPPYLPPVQGSTILPVSFYPGHNIAVVSFSLQQYFLSSGNRGPPFSRA